MYSRPSGAFAAFSAFFPLAFLSVAPGCSPLGRSVRKRPACTSWKPRTGASHMTLGSIHVARRSLVCQSTRAPVDSAVACVLVVHSPVARVLFARQSTRVPVDSVSVLCRCGQGASKRCAQHQCQCKCQCQCHCQCQCRCCLMTGGASGIVAIVVVVGVVVDVVFVASQSPQREVCTQWCILVRISSACHWG